MHEKLQHFKLSQSLHNNQPQSPTVQQFNQPQGAALRQEFGNSFEEFKMAYEIQQSTFELWNAELIRIKQKKSINTAW